jgi:hypothetical protein
MRSPHSYRVTIKDASALAILESLEAMQAIELTLEPATVAAANASIQSLKGSVNHKVSEAMLRHAKEVRSEWGKEDAT